MKLLSRRQIGILIAIALLLTLPLIAMQFTEEVNWTSSDFVVAAGLLLSIGLGIDIVLRKVKSTRYRLLLCAGVLFIGFLMWAELAIGLFGSPFAGS